MCRWVRSYEYAVADASVALTEAETALSREERREESARRKTSEEMIEFSAGAPASAINVKPVAVVANQIQNPRNA